MWFCGQVSLSVLDNPKIAYRIQFSPSVLSIMNDDFFDDDVQFIPPLVEIEDGEIEIIEGNPMEKVRVDTEGYGRSGLLIEYRLLRSVGRDTVAID